MKPDNLIANTVLAFPTNTAKHKRQGTFSGARLPLARRVPLERGPCLPLAGLVGTSGMRHSISPPNKRHPECLFNACVFFLLKNSEGVVFWFLQLNIESPLDLKRLH
jgi:hypothetical protein